jgi:hypothetical protein
MDIPIADIKGKQVMHEPPLQGVIYNTSAYGGPVYQPQMHPMESMQQPQMPQQHQQEELQFSDKDFEAAFQDAFLHAEGIDQMDQDTLQSEMEQEYYNANGIEEDIQQKRHLPIGSDAIHYVEQAERTHDQDSKDADDLARTAGHLLNMVQHDTSDKMKNSQFLDLMRRIRDREVEVQNNDLQSTNKKGQGVYMENETDFVAHSREAAQMQPDMQSHDPNTFDFPDMNAVYSYASTSAEQQHSRPASGTNTPRHRFPGSWDYPVTAPSPSITRPSSVPPLTSTDTDLSYSSHDDEYPRSQIQALHPGGPWYPEQKSPTIPKRARAELMGGLEMDVQPSMSGGVGPDNATELMDGGIGSGISVDDFEGRYEESAVLGRRYALR